LLSSRLTIWLPITPKPINPTFAIRYPSSCAAKQSAEKLSWSKKNDDEG
jgi:hypothetical protein